MQKEVHNTKDCSGPLRMLYVKVAIILPARARHKVHDIFKNDEAQEYLMQRTASTHSYTHARGTCCQAIVVPHRCEVFQDLGGDSIFSGGAMIGEGFEDVA